MTVARAQARATSVMDKVVHQVIPIHFCRIGSATIFLDVEKERYFALPPQQGELFHRQTGEWMQGHIAAEELETFSADPHHARVICTPKLTPRPFRTVESPATESRPSLFLIAKAVMARVIFDRIVRNVGLTRVFRHFKGDPDVSLSKQQLGEAARIATAFRHAGIIVGTEGKCLSASLAYAWLARRHGLAPAIVIGVRNGPFAAHCWCQQDGWVLNDSLEVVQVFQPIYVP